MRQVQVFYGDTLAGILTDTDEGEYQFQYTPAYVAQHPDQFLTFSLPVRSEPYNSKRLFPFFEGLIPEGWLLEIAATSWKVNRNDRMGLLMVCCRNCIGAVSIAPMEAEPHG